MIQQCSFQRASCVVCGGLLGSGTMWFVGKLLAYLLIVLPNRHLPVEQFVANTCGLGLSIGLLTYFVLMPFGLFVSAAVAHRIWQQGAVNVA